MNRLRKLIRGTKGQSVVEFALVVPILMLIMVAIFEFGRMWMTMNVITSAAYEGARVAAITAPSVSQATAAAQNVLNAARITGAIITISGPNANGEVSCQVRLNYVPLTQGIIPGFGPRVLSQTATMHWEN